MRATIGFWKGLKGRKVNIRDPRITRRTVILEWSSAEWTLLSKPRVTRDVSGNFRIFSHLTVSVLTASLPVCKTY